jgi:hypothetical protein
VEKEGDVDAFLGAGLAEPKEFWGEVGKGSSEVFLADEVVACD